MDTSVLQELLNSVSKCTSCEAEKSLVIKQNNKKRLGKCETQGTAMVEINLRSVLAATSIGGGYTI